LIIFVSPRIAIEAEFDLRTEKLLS